MAKLKRRIQCDLCRGVRELVSKKRKLYRCMVCRALGRPRDLKSMYTAARP